ncbi:hypothetical protein M0802_000277 [Mischocyttarus mexicanus]|nr:hypothetical protein M0802_000277 [Mischocyttarus mexicanus]
MFKFMPPVTLVVFPKECVQDVHHAINIIIAFSEREKSDYYNDTAEATAGSKQHQQQQQQQRSCSNVKLTNVNGFTISRMVQRARAFNI